MRFRRAVDFILITALALTGFASAARAGEDQLFEYPGPFSVDHCEAALAREPVAPSPEVRAVVDDLVRWITGTHPIFRQALNRARDKREVYLLINLVTGFTVPPAPVERGFFGFATTDPFVEFARFVGRSDSHATKQDEGYLQLEQNRARLGEGSSRAVSEVIARLVYMATLCLVQITDPANLVGPAARPEFDVAFSVDNVPNAALTTRVTIRSENLFSVEELAELGRLANAFAEPAIYQRVFRDVHAHRAQLFAAHARALAAIELHRRPIDRRDAVIQAFASNAPAPVDARPGSFAPAIGSAADEIATFVRTQRARPADDPVSAARRALTLLNQALLELAATDRPSPRWSAMLPVSTTPAAAYRELQAQLDALVDQNVVDLARLKVAREPFAQFAAWIAGRHETLGRVDVAAFGEDEATHHGRQMAFVRMVRKHIEDAALMLDLRAGLKRWHIEQAGDLMLTMNAHLIAALVTLEPLDIVALREALRDADAK